MDITKLRMIALSFIASTLVLAGTSYYFYQAHEKSVEQTQQLKANIKQKEKENQKIQDELKGASERYQSLYKEKNGTAKEKLLATTKTLYTALYNYNTADAAKVVSERKKKVAEIADDAVVSKLFPENAEETTVSVSLKSSLSEDPAVYLQSSDSNQLAALVLVHYVVKIDGSKDQPYTYLYKIGYDQFRNKITSIENLGDLSVN